MPDTGNAWIRLDLEDRTAHLIEWLEFGSPHFGIVRHRAEFVHHKWLAKTSGTALPKNYWSFRCAPNNQRDDRHGDCHDQEKDKCANSIDSTLNRQRP